MKLERVVGAFFGLTRALTCLTEKVGYAAYHCNGVWGPLTYRICSKLCWMMSGGPPSSLTETVTQLERRKVKFERSLNQPQSRSSDVWSSANGNQQPRLDMRSDRRDDAGEEDRS